MRAFRECVFDDTIIGETTVYTATQFNRLLASVPDLVIQANSFNVAASDDYGELSVQIQESADGRNWLDKYDTAEIDQVDTEKNKINVDVGYDDGTEPSMPQVRLKITTAGNTERTGLKIWVTGRAVIPGSVRQAVAARQRAAARAAQAPQGQAAPKAEAGGGCGGSCGCGGTCGESGGADKAPGTLSEARIAGAVAARRGRAATLVGRVHLADWDPPVGEARLHGPISDCNQISINCGRWCKENLDTNECYSCCNYNLYTCRGETPLGAPNDTCAAGWNPEEVPDVGQFSPTAFDPASNFPGKPKPSSQDRCRVWDVIWWGVKSDDERALYCKGKSDDRCAPTCWQFKKGSKARTDCMNCCWCYQLDCQASSCGRFPDIFAETGCKHPSGSCGSL